jgi:hypothetical protein
MGRRVMGVGSGLVLVFVVGVAFVLGLSVLAWLLDRGPVWLVELRALGL